MTSKTLFLTCQCQAEKWVKFMGLIKFTGLIDYKIYKVRELDWNDRTRVSYNAIYKFYNHYGTKINPSVIDVDKLQRCVIKMKLSDSWLTNKKTLLSHFREFRTCWKTQKGAFRS